MLQSRLVETFVVSLSLCPGARQSLPEGEGDRLHLLHQPSACSTEGWCVHCGGLGSAVCYEGLRGVGVLTDSASLQVFTSFLHWLPLSFSGDVSPGQRVSVKITFSPVRVGVRKLLLDFDSDRLKDVKGVATVIVHKKTGIISFYWVNSRDSQMDIWALNVWTSKIIHFLVCRYSINIFDMTIFLISHQTVLFFLTCFVLCIFPLLYNYLKWKSLQQQY